ncbi:MAG TPA: CorA family divalent cation transporter, partial [Acidimicrobiia bacterium]
MKGNLTQNGNVVSATPDVITQAMTSGSFFWLDLDLHDPGPDDDVTGMLIDTFHFHPVAVEAAAQFGQRARIDDYDDFVHVVTFGMSGDAKFVAEVHCFVTEKFIISLHQGDCPALSSVGERVRSHHSTQVVPPQIAVLY